MNARSLAALALSLLACRPRADAPPPQQAQDARSAATPAAPPAATDAQPSQPAAMATHRDVERFYDDRASRAQTLQRVSGDPTREPSLSRDEQGALWLVRTVGGASFARALREAQCAPREVRTVCGAAMVCEERGRVQGLVPPLNADSAACLSAMYAVESALDDGLALAEHRVLAALSPQIDSDREGPAAWSAQDDSCASRPQDERTRLQNIARTRVLAWAVREGWDRARAEVSTSERRRQAANANLALTMHCPSAQGAALVSAAFDPSDASDGEVPTMSRTFWRVDARGATLLHAIDPRELRGVAWADIDAEPGDELLLLTHAWEGSAVALHALSLSRPQPIALYREDVRAGGSPGKRVLVVRDEDRAVLLLDWIAHRWTGSALTPIAQPSASLRRTLARRSGVIDARATARDALLRVPVDAEALDDALAVAGVDEPRIRTIVGALR